MKQNMLNFVYQAQPKMLKPSQLKNLYWTLIKDDLSVRNIIDGKHQTIIRCNELTPIVHLTRF